MSLDPSKFVSGVKARRYQKDLVVVEGDVYRPLQFNRPTFTKEQIVLETPDCYVVSPVKLKDRQNTVISVNLDAGWNLLTEFMTGTKTKDSTGEDTDGLVRPGFGIEPVFMDDVDRVLNVLQDMGRWDIAFGLIARLLGLGQAVPASWVVWEKFPHKSKMLLMTTSNRGIFLSGCMKDVVEKWWAYCGGYHNPKGWIYQPDSKEYQDFMAGVRNPYRLAGVTERAAYERIEKELVPVEAIPDDIKLSELGGREYLTWKGLVYLKDATGSMLPYWYCSGSQDASSRPLRVGWDSEMRNRLAGHMNLPLLVQRTVEKTLDLGTIDL